MDDATLVSTYAGRTSSVNPGHAAALRRVAEAAVEEFNAVLRDELATFEKEYFG